jgi:F0F1-type ATP synthase membrane subunit b/b'
LAGELHKQSEELHTAYESKARQINGQIKEIFDHSRAEAGKQADVILGKARQEAQALVEKARSTIAGEVSAAESKLRDEAPQIAQAITNQLLAKH